MDWKSGVAPGVGAGMLRGASKGATLGCGVGAAAAALAKLIPGTIGFGAGRERGGGTGVATRLWAPALECGNLGQSHESAL